MSRSASIAVAKLKATTAEDVVRALARALEQRGHVKPSFEAAAATRERRSPTGLPFSPIPIAIPHADPSHVLAPAIAVATLDKPVRFRQMGAPSVMLDVELVVVPALQSKDQAAAELTTLIERFQDENLRRALVSATTEEEMRTVLDA